jgi:hypothetical protein
MPSKPNERNAGRKVTPKRDRLVKVASAVPRATRARLARLRATVDGKPLRGESAKVRETIEVGLDVLDAIQDDATLRYCHLPITDDLIEYYAKSGNGNLGLGVRHALASLRRFCDKYERKGITMVDVATLIDSVTPNGRN